MIKKTLRILICTMFIVSSFSSFFGVIRTAEAGRSEYTFYSTTSDGMIGTWGDNYNDIRNADEGYVNENFLNIRCGQAKSAHYQIDRAFLFFDTSSIPDNIPIISASLSIYGDIDYSQTDFYLVVQNGQPTYPHDPMVSGDYDKDHYSGSGGTFHTSNFNENAYNTITLNSDGKSWINKQGYTKLCLRSKRDIDGNTPSQLEFVTFCDSEEGSGYQPKLTVEYNNAPNKPSKPQGQTAGNANTDYTYTTSATDPEGDQVYYKFDWDDGTYSDWVGPYNSGQSGSATHNWECSGSFSIKAKAKDIYDQESPWSDKLTVTISNNQPNPPSNPTGTTSGYHGVSYTYSTSATDPDNHQVKIYFDWGDGTGTWTDYVNSGQSVSKSHTWNAPGNYDVKAKAKDTCGLEGGWSGVLPVYMQNQAPNIPNTPNPIDGATGIGTDTILSWSGGDPNGDTVYYDVYFGAENPPPKVIDGQTSTNYDPPGDLEVLTTYYWQIIAEDEFGDQAIGLIWSFTTRLYNPPVLSNYDGWPTGHIPLEGNQQTDFTFRIHYQDADQDPPVEKKLLFSNGKEFTMTLFNGQAYNGDYEIVLKGSQIGGGTQTYWFWYKDIHDGVRFPPAGEEWAVTINHAPNAPILSGPSNGIPGTEYIFSAVADDPEGDDIKYWFDWGDGKNTGWIPEAEWKASGNKIDAEHSWSKGTYTIRAKAMDRDGDESPWSNEITLKVQKSRALNNEFFRLIIQNLIQKLPLLQKILNLFVY